MVQKALPSALSLQLSMSNLPKVPSTVWGCGILTFLPKPASCRFAFSLPLPTYLPSSVTDPRLQLLTFTLHLPPYCSPSICSAGCRPRPMHLSGTVVTDVLLLLLPQGSSRTKPHVYSFQRGNHSSPFAQAALATLIFEALQHTC
jgi:hypothetical protein